MKKIVIFMIILLLIDILISGIFVSTTYATDNETTQLIEGGIYEIEIKQNQSKVLDISGASTLSQANVQIWDRSNVLQQRFEIKYSSRILYNKECKLWKNA